MAYTMRDDLKKSILDPVHKARTERVRDLREMTGLSRRAFAQKYKLPISTMQNWEDLKGNGLTERGARKLALILKSEGIYCTAEWLMHGIGATPQFSERLTRVHEPGVTYSFPKSMSDDAQTSQLNEELNLFRQHYPKTATDLVVKDDAMTPRFVAGEYVAGIRYYDKAIETLIGVDCIVQLASGEVMLRTIKKGNLPNRYTLICTNPQTSSDKPVLYDVELISAAPVIWARRKAPGI